MAADGRRSISFKVAFSNWKLLEWKVRVENGSGGLAQPPRLLRRGDTATGWVCAHGKEI